MGTLDYFSRKPFSMGGGAGATNIYLETPLQTVLIDSDPKLRVVVISID